MLVRLMLLVLVFLVDFPLLLTLLLPSLVLLVDFAPVGPWNKVRDDGSTHEQL